jgi:ribosomal protein S18 acetylase RimI-like enzyme
MPHDLAIRSATEADKNSVVALWQACGLVTNYNDPSQDFLFALAKLNSDILVGINSENKIVGSVMVGHDGHRGWVYYVATDPAQRLKGIGSLMVEAGENWLRERHIVKVMLLVRETNTQVIDFYKHLGFETSPRTVMQKWLIKPAD